MIRRAWLVLCVLAACDERSAGRAPLPEPPVSGFIGVQYTWNATERIAEIVRVFPETPAARVGLVAGDVIVRFNGEELESSDDLVGRVRASQKGEVARLDVVRRSGDGGITTVQLRLTSWPRRLDDRTLDDQ